MFRQKFICGDSPVGRGDVMVQDPVTRSQLLRAMSVHSVAEALHDCFVDFLIYRLSCRDKFMMNQPVNVKERINMVLIWDFTCRAFFGRGDDDDDDVLHWEDICFVSRSYL